MALLFAEIEINLSGMTLSEATNYIKAVVAKKYIGTNFFNNKNIRDINVVIAGNVFNPGIYTISGNSNPLHTSNMAGGVNEFGSFREILVKRNKKLIHTMIYMNY